MGRRKLRTSGVIATSAFNQPEGKHCPACDKQKRHEAFWSRGRSHIKCNHCRAADRKGAKLRRPGSNQVSKVTVTDLEGNPLRTEDKYTTSQLVKIQGTHPGSTPPRARGG